MTWEDKLKNDIEKYCKIRGILIIRGKVPSQYKEELSRVIQILKRTYKNEYRIKKRAVLSIQTKDISKILTKGRLCKTPL
jgi:hypothetical protein